VLLACDAQGPAQPPEAARATGAPAAAAEEPTSQPARPAAAEPTSQPSAAPAAAPADGPATAGGLVWEAPEPLTARAPGSRMRAAEYAVAGEGDAAEAELTVYYFGPGQGGSVQANLDRWIGQFKQADGSDSKAAAKVEKREVGGVQVTTLDLTGTYDGGMAPMMKQDKPAPSGDYRVLGAIAEGPAGPVFFKLVGPAATVERAAAAFDSLVGSLQVKSPH
jgi:hypothetical protein